MKISFMAAVSENGVIGSGMDIPWKVKGEQLLFKATTFNQWLIVGRKTFESMGKLPNRKFAVITRSALISEEDDLIYFNSTEQALAELSKQTDHVIVVGGGEIFKILMPQVDTLHISVIHKSIVGDVLFPEIPKGFEKVFEQHFRSNIDYTYEIWQRG